MHALVQYFSSLVLALATAVFAHFGVSLKAAPCPKAHPAAAYGLPIASNSSVAKPTGRAPEAPARGYAQV